MIIYVIGRSKEVGGKLIVPFLVLIHAFFFVVIAWDIVRHPRDFSLSIGTSFLEGVLAHFALFSMPLILLLQPIAQYWELRKMPDYGALSPRSICMQAIVMAVIAMRMFIKFEFAFRGPENKKGGFWFRVLMTLFYWYFQAFESWNCLLWIGGVGLVHLATRSTKTGTVGREMELGVFLA